MQQFGGEERCPLSDDDADRHSAELDFRSAFDDAPIGMAVCAPGVILRVNAALVRLLGRSAEDIVGSDLLDITHPDDLVEARAAAASLGEHRMVRYECRLLGERGQEIPVSVSASVVVDGGGERGHQVMHFEDIGDRRRLEIELTFRALHDPLTGLPNRTLFVDRTQHALVRAHRSQVATCVVFVDLDDFKSVNDTHGHAVGDAVLVEFGRRLDAVVREGDTAARLGGDEFTVLCEDTDADQAEEVAARVRQVAAQPFAHDGVCVQLSATTGVGVAAAQLAMDCDGLLRAADAAMYSSKRCRQSELEG